MEEEVLSKVQVALSSMCPWPMNLASKRDLGKHYENIT